MNRKSKAVRMSEAGFTLVELMIVVAIIGILSAIAIPNFQKYQAKARQKEAQLALSSIYTAETSNMAEHGSFTSCLRQAGYTPEGGVAAAQQGDRYYAVGFSSAGAALAFCNDASSPAIPCNRQSTVGIAAPAVVTTCGAVTNVAFPALLVDTMYHSYGANKKVGNTAGPVEAQMTAAHTAAGVAAFTAGTFSAVAVGNIANTNPARFDTWSINNNKILLNNINGI